MFFGKSILLEKEFFHHFLSNTDVLLDDLNNADYLKLQEIFAHLDEIEKEYPMLDEPEVYNKKISEFVNADYKEAKVRRMAHAYKYAVKGCELFPNGGRFLKKPALLLLKNLQKAKEYFNKNK